MTTHAWRSTDRPTADADQLRRLFWVVGNTLGEAVMQNARGEILSEVTDRFAGAERGPDTRGYESNDELRFHYDGGDSIGLCCVIAAPTGGDNGLVSLRAIREEMVAHHPEEQAALECVEARAGIRGPVATIGIG